MTNSYSHRHTGTNPKLETRDTQQMSECLKHTKCWRLARIKSPGFMPTAASTYCLRGDDEDEDAADSEAGASEAVAGAEAAATGAPRPQP